MTVRSNFNPARAIDPYEPGLVAGYQFSDLELCQFNRYLNRCASTGAAYDLTMLSGTPIVGQGGGVAVVVNGNRYYRTVSFPVGTTPTYAMEGEEIGVAGLGNWRASNGDAHGFANWPANLSFTMNWPGVLSTCPFSLVGRGPYRADGLYDGTNQILTINGVSVASVAVVPTALGVISGVGSSYTTRKFLVYDIRKTVAQARASYVRDFARKVLWQWTPTNEVASITTGTLGGMDEWWCPLGAATMGIVWRSDLSAPGGGRLALTDTQTAALNRIAFPCNRPWFGSILVEYQVRNPATDNMVVGFTPTRDVDPTAAASNSYWSHTRTVAGTWRSSAFLANGAQIASADAAAVPVANARCKVLLTRGVDGVIRVYQQTPAGWAGPTTTGTDVAVLSEGYVVIAPRGPYVERVTYLQGEVSPEELAQV